MEIIQLLKKDDLFNKAIDVFWKEWGEEGGRAFYPALMGSKTLTSKFSESKEVRWGINCP